MSGLYPNPLGLRYSDSGATQLLSGSPPDVQPGIFRIFKNFRYASECPGPPAKLDPSAV